MVRRAIVEKKIITAYCQLLLSKDKSDITTNDVYLAAEISRSSFYNYFHNIEEVEEGVLDFILDRLNFIIQKNMLLQKKFILQVLQFIDEHRDIYYPIFLKYEQIETIVSQFIKQTILNSDIRNLNQKLEISYKIPSKYSLEIYVMTFQTIITTWIRSNFEETPENIADLIYKSVPF